SCPGHHESAGHTKNTKVRPGNPYLKEPSARGIRCDENQRHYLQARHKRLTARRGPLKALVADKHSIITAIWHMLTDNVAYQELSGTHFTQRDPERVTRRRELRRCAAPVRRSIPTRPEGQSLLEEVR
ncbi:hypothetical protein AB0N17_45600, partial [Streptomyces sp. NPDC051133]